MTTNTTVLATRNRRFYHGTSTAFLAAIKSEGIRPSDQTGNAVWTGNLTPMPGHVYLTTDPDLAIKYSIDATSTYPGERLILVFELDRDDPRVRSDEDIVPKIWGALVEQRIIPKHVNGRKTERALEILTELADGIPPDNIDPYSTEHVILISKVSGIFSGKLGDIIDALDGPRPAMVDYYLKTADPSDYKRFVDVSSNHLREALTKCLLDIAPSKHISVKEVIRFLSSDVPSRLDSGAQESGGNRAVWHLKYVDELSHNWPNWFGGEAGLVSKLKPTVAVNAMHLRPDEYWIWKGRGRVKSYEELVRGSIAASVGKVIATSTPGYDEVKRNVLAWISGFGDPITLYREIRVKDPSSINFDNPGRYWTPELDKAHSPFKDGDGVDIILEAVADRNDVDEFETVATFRRYPGEREIRLLRGASISITGYWMGGKFTKYVRPQKSIVSAMQNTPRDIKRSASIIKRRILDNLKTLLKDIKYLDRHHNSDDIHYWLKDGSEWGRLSLPSMVNISNAILPRLIESAEYIISLINDIVSDVSDRYGGDATFRKNMVSYIKSSLEHMADSMAIVVREIYDPIRGDVDSLLYAYNNSGYNEYVPKQAFDIVMNMPRLVYEAHDTIRRSLDSYTEWERVIRVPVYSDEDKKLLVPKHDNIETMYHASINARELARTGFTIGYDPTANGIGGSTMTDSGKQAISFTHDMHIAQNISRCLKEAIAIAKGEVKASDIIEWSTRAGVLDKVLSSYSSIVGGDGREAKSRKRIFDLYRYYLAHSDRYDPLFFGDTVKMLNIWRHHNVRDVGIIIAEVDMSNSDISYYHSMREHRVPPEAVVSITRVIL